MAKLLLSDNRLKSTQSAEPFCRWKLRKQPFLERMRRGQNEAACAHCAVAATLNLNRSFIVVGRWKPGFGCFFCRQVLCFDIMASWMKLKMNFLPSQSEWLRNRKSTFRHLQQSQLYMFQWWYAGHRRVERFSSSIFAQIESPSIPAFCCPAGLNILPWSQFYPFSSSAFCLKCWVGHHSMHLTSLNLVENLIKLGDN